MSVLISSLPGKDVRTLVESRVLLSDSTCILEAEPGKLDIKRREPGILFINLQADSHRSTVQMRDYDVTIIFFCQFNVIDDVIQKVQCHDDAVSRSTCNNAINKSGN